MEPDHIRAHEHSIRHREEILKSDLCGCFYCLHIFSPLDVEEWCDRGTTARCPKCLVDSVIGSASGYPITEGFLREMNRHWF